MKKFKHINRIIDLLIEINIWSIVFFTPLIFALFFETNNVFELPKIVFLKIFIIFLFSLSFLKFFMRRFYTNRNIFLDFFKNNKFLIAIFTSYYFSLSISMFISEYHQKSFYGSYERQLGLVSYFVIFLFFILFYMNVDKKRDIYRVLNTLVFSSSLISVYAIIQSFGLDPFSWIESTSLRAVSTLGQPNFLGAFLLLTIPLNIFFYRTRFNYSKYLYLSNIFIGILAIGFTYSISSWIGGVFALFLFILFGLNKISFSKQIKNKYFVSVLVAFIILPILFVSNSYIFRTKINSVLNFSNGSTAARINYWQASIKAIKEKPFLGYGLDTQGEILPKYYERDWGVHSNVGVRPDRAHNIFLDILLTTGIFGLISYLLLIFLFFRIIFLNIKQKKEPFLNYVIAVSVSAYLISLLFNFSFLTSELIFFLYFSIILKINLLDEKKKPEEGIQRTKYYLAIVIFKIIITFILMYFIIGMLKTEINKLIADKYYLDIRQARINNEYFKALTLFDYIEELNLKTNYYNNVFGQILAKWTPDIEKYGRIYNIKGAEYMNNIYEELSDCNYKDREAKALVLSVLSRDNKKYLEDAEKVLLSIIDDYPEIPRNYYNLADYYYNNEELYKAKNIVDVSLVKIPDIDNQNLNPDHLQKVKEEYFINLVLFGDINMKNKNLEAAFIHYQKASKLLEKPVIYYKLAELFKEKDDFEQAIWYNKKAIELDPDNHTWHHHLAKIYFKKGDMKNSLAEVNKALKIFPQHSESIILKKEIEENFN